VNPATPPRSPWSAGILTAFGVACLVVAVLTRASEVHHLLPWMGWGFKHSAGHYLNLVSSILGIVLASSGFLLRKVFSTPRSYRPAAVP
jgi:hypothetical protein